MSAAQSVDERYAVSMARAKERAARAAANVQISTSAPVVQVVPVLPVTSAVVPPAVLDEVALPTKEAQCQALTNMGLIGLKTRADDVYLVIATACRAGVQDLTGREIQSLYERRYGRRIESGTISARVSELIAAHRVLRRPVTRVCTVTGEMAAPVYVVMKQVRLVY
jgi:hypothetical protein